MLRLVSQANFENNLNNYFSPLPSIFSRDSDLKARNFLKGRISVDIWEDEDKFVLEADLPGRDPGDIQLTLDKRVLSIEVLEQSLEASEASFLLKERFSGKLKRMVNLAEDVDSEYVNSKYRDGVLTVTLPKTQKAKVKKIEIE
tara:strand:- start:72 stop:503 length:432 start_codon:yes stop_codon:yes gene_type:complete